ncbi:Methylated-DNA--protein-cysteine methyltransferase [Candidatus Hepatincola sp. Pdp]
MTLKSPHYIGVNTTKILCKPNCKDLTKVAESNKIVFATLAEAHAKNFIKCSKCFYKSSKILRDNLLKADCKSIMDTPIGQLTFLFHHNSLNQILFDNDKDLLAETKHIPLNNNYPSFQIVENLFTKYFQKEKVDFTNIPIKITGTSFQQQVFQGLSHIKYGNTISYKSFSEKYFQPSQLRAVSSQIGKNPLPIIFPCHRVIGSNNSLTGFLGGLDKKQKLLALEGNSNTWK